MKLIVAVDNNWGIGYNAIFVLGITFVLTLIACLGLIYLKSLLFRKELF